MNLGDEPRPLIGQVLRERCLRAGVPTWRCDTAGVIVAEPLERGLAGLWLRSGEVSLLVESAARECAGKPEGRLSEPCAGMRLLAIPEMLRGRPCGAIVAAALGPELLDSLLFSTVCQTANLEWGAARQAMARLALFEGAAARSVLGLVGAAAGDLWEAGDLERTVEGFTTELTRSFETLSVLYELGSSMRDIDEPGRFLARMCELVHETLPYGWFAAVVADDPALGGPLAGAVHCRGASTAEAEEVRQMAAWARGQLNARRPSLILDGAPGRPGSPRGQGVAQAVFRGTHVAGVLLAGDRHGDDPQVTSYDTKFLEAAAGFVGAFLDNARLYADVQAVFLGSVRALTAAIDAKDRYTRGHSERVAELARRLALEAGLDQAGAGRIHLCGLLHDVGKIGVPEAVLSKVGKLSDEEFALVRRHPEIGHGILSGIPRLSDILPGVLHHHERWDGLGYPRGLRGEQTPLIARLIGLADAFDAMSSNRAYRGAMPREAVLAEMLRCAGTQFDPRLAPLIAQIDLSVYDAMVAGHATGQGWREAA